MNKSIKRESISETLKKRKKFICMGSIDTDYKKLESAFDMPDIFV